MSRLNLEKSLIDDRYAIERWLGSGSFAEIFLARDLESQQNVIIKALNVALQGTPDPELERTLIENFQNEAIALDKVRHPNIICRLGHGTAADLEGMPFHYIVLEYMPGGDLLKLCRQKPLSLDQVIFYFRQVSDGLAHAHRQGIIHRDIKPSNLLLSADHQIVKIADFGVAKIAPAAGDPTRVGTRVYAPPEHNPDGDDPSGPLTPSADIYSLAKTIYTVMVGHAPREFASRQITHLPERLMSEPWGGDLLNLLRRATDPHPANRYQSVEEFWGEFERLVAGEEATLVRPRGLAAQFNPIAQPAFEPLHVGQALGPGATITKLSIKIATPIPEGPSRPESKAAPKLRSALSTLRGIPKQTWLKWARLATALILSASLIWIVFYTYRRFKERGIPQAQVRQERVQTPPATYIGKKGRIANALEVNLRARPGGEVLATLPRGTQVEILEAKGAWVKVKVGGDPKVGWVHSRYVEVE